MNRLRLGLLDLAQVEPPRTHVEVVHDSVELAPFADSLGYSRYWLAEHHSPGVAHASPEILLPLLAAQTTRLRVGTAGVLLGYHSPYKVAANFRLLEALFPGRVDLGVARGTAAGNVGKALLDGRAEPADTNAHAGRVDVLLAALHGWSDVVPSPLRVQPPAVWLLGSGRESSRVAASRGTSFSLALFFRQWVSPAVLEEYRTEFQARTGLPEPRCNIAVAGACAETSVEARRIIAGWRNEFVLPTVVGSADECAEKLHELAFRFGVDEVIFLDVAAQLAARKRTCELLSAALDLQPLGLAA